MSICNWDCQWMGTQSPGLFNLAIGERCATSFWALFQRKLTEIIRGYLMPDLSRNLVHLRWLLKLIDFRAAGELS
ncbi:hypothetical protein Gotur_031720 [Gossypium turneri]